MATSERELIKKISADRGNTELAPELTEQPVAVDVSAETPEVTEEVVEEVVADATPEAEEPVATEEEASTDTPESDNPDDEELYVTIGDREVSLSEVGEWEQGNLRQADYTRKTQALADERKTFEADREGNTEQHKQLAERIATLDAIIAEDTLTPEALKDLREYEPEEFIKYQEKIASRKEILGAAQATQPVNNIDVEAERTKLWAANPSWLKDGVQTDAFTNDMTVLKTYALGIGYSDQELAGLSHAHHFQTLMDAAKFQAMSKKNASIEKKVRKAPVTTRPKAATQSSLVTKIEQAQANHKRLGTEQTAMKLMRLRRQLTG